MIKDFYAKGLLFEQVILNLYSDEERLKQMNDLHKEMHFEDFEYAIYNMNNIGYAIGLLFNNEIVDMKENIYIKSFRKFDNETIRYLISMSIYRLIYHNSDFINLATWTSEDFKEIEDFIDRQLKCFTEFSYKDLFKSPKAIDTIFAKSDSFEFGFEQSKLYLKTKDFKVNLPNRIFYCIIDSKTRKDFILSCLDFEYIKYLRGINIWKTVQRK